VFIRLQTQFYSRRSRYFATCSAYVLFGFRMFILLFTIYFLYRRTIRSRFRIRWPQQWPTV